MKQNLSHILERIKSIYIYIYIGRHKPQLSHLSLSNLSRLNHSKPFSFHIKFSHYLRLAFLLASAALIAIMTLAVFPIVRETFAAEAASSGTASSITMTTTSASARLNLNVTDPSGVFVKSSSSETINFGVKTNNYTGYTLSISSDDDLGYLTNTDPSITTNNKLNSITTTTDELTFSDASNASLYNGKWGYKPSKINSVDNVAFLPSPTTTATTLDTTESANPDTNNDYTIGLGARADYALSAGTYAHTFNLVAVANPVDYAITYNDNTGDSTVMNLPDGTLKGSQYTYTTTATSLPLSTVTPSRTGYTFNGWCNTAPTINADGSTNCTGTVYAVGEDYPIDQTSSNTIILYATWAVTTFNVTIKPSTGISSITLGSTTCTNATTGCIVSGLVHGKSYTLAATTDTGYGFVAWSNNGSGLVSDINSATTTYTVLGEATVVGIATNCTILGTMQNPTITCGDATPNETTGFLTDSRDNQGYTVAKINGKWWMTRNLAIGCSGSGSTYGGSVSSKSLTSSTSNVSSTWSTPTALLSAASSSTQTADYSAGRMECNATYGAWYNYYAATAGTISGNPNTTNATKDICPAGWRLPTDDEFSGIKSSVSAFSPVTGGYYYYGSLSGTDGIWWSATANNNTFRYYLGYNGSSLYSGRSLRYHGLYVRCIKS